MSHRGAVLSLYGCDIALAVAALVLVVMKSLKLAILLASSLTILTVAFFALIIVRARIARHERDHSLADVPPSSRPSVTSGGALGRR